MRANILVVRCRRPVLYACKTVLASPNETATGAKEEVKIERQVKIERLHHSEMHRSESEIACQSERTGRYIYSRLLWRKQGLHDLVGSQKIMPLLEYNAAIVSLYHGSDLGPHHGPCECQHRDVVGKLEKTLRKLPIPGADQAGPKADHTSDLHSMVHRLAKAATDYHLRKVCSTFYLDVVRGHRIPVKLNAVAETCRTALTYDVSLRNLVCMRLI